VNDETTEKELSRSDTKAARPAHLPLLRFALSVQPPAVGASPRGRPARNQRHGVVDDLKP
jgi:hypothetical protein